MWTANHRKCMLQMFHDINGIFSNAIRLRKKVFRWMKTDLKSSEKILPHLH